MEEILTKIGDGTVIAKFEQKKEGIVCPEFWECKPFNGCKYNCQWCVDGATMIMRPDLSWSRLDSLQVDDLVMGFKRSGSTRFFATPIQAIRKVIRPRLKLTTDKATIICSYEHRLLSKLGRWATAKHLGTSEVGIAFLTTPSERTPEDAAYMAGYLHGISDGDGTMGHYEYEIRPDIHSYRLAMQDEEAIDRAEKYFKILGIEMNRFMHKAGSGTPLHAIRKSGVNNYNKIIELFKTYSRFNDYKTGYIAGIFDAEGSFSGSSLRIYNTNPDILQHTKRALAKIGLKSYIENYPPHCPTLRVSGGIKECLHFFNITNPAIKRKWPKDFTARFDKTSPVSKAERLEPGELIDIQTGTENFIANGLASHNCYLNGTYRFKKDDRGVKIGKSPTFKDVEKVELHIRKAMEAINGPSLFNCGEVSDGLLYPWVLEKHVFPVFKEWHEKKGHKVLILTKNTDVSCLYRAQAQNCAIIAFSVNAEFVSSTWETKAPHPWKRLEAARKVSEWGYPVRLRIDPMVPVEDWHIGYRELVDKIMQYVPNTEVITIGSLRMMTTNLNICEKLGNDTTYVRYLGEKTSRDRRAPAKTRIEMYDFVIKELRDKGYTGHISLCKETDEVWKDMCSEKKPKRKNEPMIPPRLKRPEQSVCNCKLGTMYPDKPKEETPCTLKEE